MSFLQHRTEFTSLAEAAVNAHRESRPFGFPSTSFYRDAGVYDLDGKIVVEFIVDDFYRPIVFVSTDNPRDAYDTCSDGGLVTKKLAPCWYICRRDWN